MNRIIRFFLLLAMVFTMSCPAFAAEKATSSINIDVLIGTKSDSTDESTSRAVNIPTSYAPSNWYNKKHDWTAKYYTWSSYIFTCGKGKYFDCSATQPFKVQFFYADGTSMGTWSAVQQSGKYEVNAIMDGASASTGYYVKIINTDTRSITSGADYEVWS